MELIGFDIGAEIISILTRGMYPDPRDVVREYIQNGIDAGAENIQVKVRLDSVVVQDNGVGMDYATLRKAVRLGISDKNPKNNVGFMGIGIYSAFHLCEKMTIHTRKKDANPLRLVMDFKSMKEHLDIQKELRFSEKITSEQLTDLQTLLEQYINLTNDDELSLEEFPHEGTWIELVGLDPILYDYLIDFDSISSYLQEVVPLHFESEENFKWGPLIESKINQICEEHDAGFQTVNLKLRVNNKSADLYRPYKNSDFHNDKPQAPVFQLLKRNRIFLGVAWGCLNSARKRISEKEKRGFLLKKQGFAIGRRDDLARFFGRSNTYFDRYIGEVVLVNPEILPNGARNDLEVSIYKTIFDDVMLNNVSKKYSKLASKFQEENIAEEKLNQAIEDLTKVNEDYTPFKENTDTLTKLIKRISLLEKNIQPTKLTENKKQEARAFKEQANELKKAIKERFDVLINKQKKINQRQTQNNVAQTLKQININSTDIPKSDSLLDLIKNLNIDLSEDLTPLLSVIDEKFIQTVGNSTEHYKQLLEELKNDYLSLKNN